MGDRVAYYKTILLGDTIRGHETPELAGEDPAIESALGATDPLLTERGGGSYYEVELIALMFRTDAESDDDFIVRKIALLVALRSARGFGSGTTSLGDLAVCSDSDNIQTASGSLTAGSNVAITTGVANVSTGQKWFISDDSNYEVFTSVAGSYAGGITAAVLVNNYSASAKLFKVTWTMPKAFLRAGIRIPGNEDGSQYAAKEISLKFVSLEDPTL